MNIGLARERARSQGLTQQEIANQLGVTRASVAKWFTGENHIPSQYVIPLADLLGVTADRLLREEAQLQGTA